MTLRNGRIGNTYIVDSINIDVVAMRRLEALGLTRGTQIKVLNCNRGGALVIMVRGSRLAIGKAIAESIQMKETK